MQIKEISAKTIKNSRGEETIEVAVRTPLGVFVSSAPSGKSKGKNETLDYSDKITEIVNRFPHLQEKISKVKFEEFKDLEEIEKVVTKKDFGANPLYALEVCLLKAVAAERGDELWQVVNERASRFPYPVGNCIGGGLHTAHFQGRKADFQEFLIIPRARKFADNFYIMKGCHKMCGESLKARSALGTQNDEGAWSTSIDDNEILDVLNKARDELTEMTGDKIEIGIDVAASTFFEDKMYHYKNTARVLTKEEQMENIIELMDKYRVGYVEDPLEEEDFDGFAMLRKKILDRLPALIVGDDLTVSNLKRFGQALVKKSVSAIIVKPNQNGSLWEIKKLVDYAKKYEKITVMSHRSGETMDYALADLAFGFQTEFIKTGIMGKEREMKLKRLVDIEKNLSK